MKDRNEFLEMGGLFYDSDTHEWFHDKVATNHAHNDTHNDALPNIICFVIRNKETGEYDRAIMDIPSNEVMYSSKSLEEIAFFIDQLKIQKRFK